MYKRFFSLYFFCLIFVALQAKAMFIFHFVEPTMIKHMFTSNFFIGINMMAVRKMLLQKSNSIWPSMLGKRGSVIYKAHRMKDQQPL